MSLRLDSTEVLEHLKCLGYKNITQEQLKDFMRDLKKLIRHDEKQKQRQRLAREEYLASPESCCDCPDTFEYETPSDNNEGGCCNECDCGCQPPVSGSTGPTYEPKPSYKNPRVDDVCQNEDPLGPSKEGQRSQTASVAGTRKQNVLQPKPGSFIRPSTKGGASQKCDPVSLYHRYQNLWARQPLPGEDPRSDLRWNIRHKMMGAQKTKRPQSCKEREEEILPNDLDYPEETSVRTRICTHPEKKRKLIKQIPRTASVDKVNHPHPFQT